MICARKSALLCGDWLLDHAYLLVPAQAYVGQALVTFKEFPPRQEPASFSPEKAIEAMHEVEDSK